MDTIETWFRVIFSLGPLTGNCYYLKGLWVDIPEPCFNCIHDFNHLTSVKYGKTNNQLMFHQFYQSYWRYCRILRAE